VALWAAAGVSVAVPALQPALAAADQQASGSSSSSSAPQEVVITGSLIPQIEKETANPVTVITAEDITQKGFVTVADALQRASLSTGAVQGPQFVNGFTPGANVISLFGLAPGYAKFLIDGRPIADYPALYNGTDVITDISTIPTILVDRIDILPGGQSSIYGSDAIAGVVNIILKKHQDGLQADYRYGWTNDGGGSQNRIGVSDGFSFGALNVLVAGQYDNVSPIWGYQRPLTSQYFNGNPSSPAVAERDWLILGTLGPIYTFLDPNDCANVTSQFNGTAGLKSRAGRGQYCGTTSSGYYTANNGTTSEQGFVSATYDLNDKLQLYTEVLASHAVTSFNTGTVFLGTSNFWGSSPYWYYFDPNVGDLLNLQRIFSPEEAGNLSNQMNLNTNNTLRATAGARGELFSTGWKYDVDFTYTGNKLREATHLAFTDKIYNFFSTIMGPNLGLDPNFGQPTYTPNYTQYYKPLTPAQYASFTGYAYSYSWTEDSLARAQLTNTTLFHLPGGDAGIALVAEGGRQGWQYNPDPSFLNQQAYLYTAVGGDGHRTRYAGTAELRLPVLTPLTITASGRYDDYKLEGGSVDKFTYNLGLEYRPLKSLLLRGRYGTAFKAPTLADEFQGQSGFFTTATDYYWCYKAGFTVTTLAQCSQSNQSVFGNTQGNPALKPITATVADAGIVWSPFEAGTISVDYLHWDIKNEVFQEDIDQLLRTEAGCLLGSAGFDPSSPTCTAAEAQVQRSAAVQGDPGVGKISVIQDPKLNLSEEKLGDLVFAVNYTFRTGVAGSFNVNGSYTRALNHGIILFPGDPEINSLNNPYWSTEFRTKENLAVTWSIGDFNTTAFIERYGQTPNYRAQLFGEFGDPGTATLRPWTIANLSFQYQVLSGLVATFNVNNVFNRMPPFDPTYPGTSNQPYNIFNYNDYGREFFAGLSYKMR
jgi:outer membrane receptor protein involved in Fe transport